LHQAATFFAALLALAPLASAADSALLDLIMPDAKVVFGANVSRIVASPLGKSFTAGKEAQVRAALAGITAATGFNPARDLEEVLVASTGGPKDAPTLVLLRGIFDTERVRAFAQNNGAQVSNYNGTEMFTGARNMGAEKVSGAFAVLDQSIAIGGPLEQVRAAIRRRHLGAKISPDLSRKIAALSENYDVWAVSLAPASGLASRLGDSRAGATAEMLKAIEQFSGGVKFGDGFEFAAEILSHTQGDAERLGGGLQTFAAILQSDPRTKCPDCLKIRVEEATVHVSLIVPASVIQQSLQARNKPRVEAPANTDIVIQSSPGDMGTVKLAQP
jgi:hypothetical protein